MVPRVAISLSAGCDKFTCFKRIFKDMVARRFDSLIFKSVRVPFDTQLLNYNKVLNVFTCNCHITYSL